MKTISVQMVWMGSQFPRLNLSDVVRVANKAQRSFHFRMGDAIETVGPPDQDGQYSFKSVAQLLQTTRVVDDAGIIVGVIDEQLFDELFSAVDEGCRYIIISICDIKGILNPSKKSYADYVLCEVAAQLLAIEYRRIKGISADPKKCEPPWHLETKSCLFDYDETRRQTYKKMMWPQLCAPCSGLLSQANVPQRTQDACLSIVKKGIRPVRSALRDTSRRSSFWCFIGVLLGGVLFNQELVPTWLSVSGIAISLLIIIIRSYKNQFTDL